MAKEKIIESADNASLSELIKSRELHLLSAFSTQVKVQSSITHWEQVMCAGFNPYYHRLEAVISVKQSSGYSGGLCSNGSKEYVQFFLDFKDGAGFRDMGYTSFKVANIPDTPPGPQHPLSYSAFLFIEDKKYQRLLDCDKAVIPTLRVVLSWNSIPSSNASQLPQFGNRIDAPIQLARRPWIYWKDIVDITKIKGLDNMIDPEFEINFKNALPENIDVIHKINKAAEISVHRTFYSTIGSRINSEIDFSKANALLNINNFNDYGIDLQSFYNFFNGSGEKADTSFEELTCVGLNTLTDRLSAIIHIKKSSGFSGNLCTKGSMEHVAFWADWNNNGVFEQYVGTVSINVHDIGNIPKEGLYYSIQMPLKVADRLKLCSAPNVIRIRAVLSWESLPSTTNPNLLNHWGNYKDALVQVRPAFRPGSGIHSAIYEVGRVSRGDISTASFLYNAGPASTTSNRPWGGRITFHGIIDRQGFGGTIKYRFLVKPLGAPDSAFQPVSTSETFSLDNIFDLAGPFPDTQSDPNGWYVYKQNVNIGLYNVQNYLAAWEAGTKTDGAYTVRFVHTDEFSNEVIADQFTIQVCNTQMTVSLTANTSVDVSKDLDLVIDGGDCHSYTPAAPTIHGHLRALHPYFASWILELQPTSHTHGVIPSPNTREHSFIGDNGDANSIWTLNTAALDPCGYTVSLIARSRVILNSNPGDLPPYGPKAVGFAKLP